MFFKASNFKLLSALSYICSLPINVEKMHSLFNGIKKINEYDAKNGTVKLRRFAKRFTMPVFMIFYDLLTSDFNHNPTNGNDSLTNTCHKTNPQAHLVCSITCICKCCFFKRTTLFCFLFFFQFSREFWVCD